MGPRADRPTRRTFTHEYKDASLAEYDAAERGQRGSILRREPAPPRAFAARAVNASICASRGSFRRRPGTGSPGQASRARRQLIKCEEYKPYQTQLAVLEVA